MKKRLRERTAGYKPRRGASPISHLREWLLHLYAEHGALQGPGGRRHAAALLHLVFGIPNLGASSCGTKG